MIPTPKSNTTATAMSFLEHSSTITPTPAPHRAQAPIRPSPTTSARPAAWGFTHLAPETRNAIYELAFESPLAFFIIAADTALPSFRLRERSEQSQHDAVHALQALGLVNRQIRGEARTFFYASKNFLVLPYGYEYLPVFVHWLHRIGPKCRALLRSICLAGYMWYQPSTPLNRQFHALLQSCVNLRRLTLQLNIWHLCDPCTAQLDAYLSIDGPGPHDGPMPEIDVSLWAETIAGLQSTHTVRLDIIMSFDRRRNTIAKEKEYIYFKSNNGRALAKDVERRLREHVEKMSIGREVKIFVRYVGKDERAYYGQPW
jgi:hypothetical protein